MKKIALALALLGMAPVVSFAAAGDYTDGPRQLSNVAVTYQSTSTCFSVAITSYSGVIIDPVNVMRSTVTVWRDAWIQNHDSGVNLYYSENINVSTAALVNGVIDTSKVFMGVEVWPASATNPLPAHVPLAPGQPLYLTCGSLTRKSQATVCLGR